MDNNRLYYIDGLKGLSALIVVLCHIGIVVWGMNVNGIRPIWLTFPFVRELFNGNLAVYIFVILSSILTCHNIEVYKDEILVKYKSIITKRYFRIFFPVGLVICVMFLSNELGLFYAEEYGIKTGNKWLIGQYTVYQNLIYSLIMSPFGKCGSVLNVGWMLYLVFIGTFIVVILDLMLRGKKLGTMTMVCLFCMLLALWYDYRYISVIFGFFLYHFFVNYKEKKKYFGFLFLVSFLLLEFRRHSELCNILQASSLIGLVYSTYSLQKLLSNKPLVWVGKVSFNLYLLQLFVIYSFTCRIAYNMDMNDTMAQFIVFSSSITLIILFSWLWKKHIDPITEKAIKKVVLLLN